eukprot:TRINITY_DN6133_c0_g1_i1.p2 TRINITY_DN6133_c0_g1~~TRINITY_DN6133_c0_g1_i1.p2  ORF type:complete len:208 (-),score=48.92 TRINITY_DN6133_c0_g1_i1:182-805(-)
MAFLLKQPKNLYYNSSVFFAPLQRAGYAVATFTDSAGFEAAVQASKGDSKPYMIYVQHPKFKPGMDFVPIYEQFSNKHPEMVFYTFVGGSRETRDAMNKYSVKAMPCWACFKFGKHVENNYLAGEEYAFHTEWWTEMLEERAQYLSTVTEAMIEEMLEPPEPIVMPTEEILAKNAVKYNKKTYNEWVWGAKLSKDTVLKDLGDAQTA